MFMTQAISIMMNLPEAMEGEDGVKDFKGDELAVYQVLACWLLLATLVQRKIQQYLQPVASKL